MDWFFHTLDVMGNFKKMTMETEFTDKLDNLGIKYCFNEQNYDLPTLKFIIVGDNPGNIEYKENKFFIGPSGQVLREHFCSNELVGNFENECIIYNKFLFTRPKHQN